MDLFTIALVLVGGAAVLIVFGLATQRERVATPELEERLERFGSSSAAQQEAAASEPSMVSERVGRAVQRRGFGTSMADLLSRADVRMTVGEFMLLRVGAMFAGFTLGFVVGRGFTVPAMGIMVGVVVAFLGWMVPMWYMSRTANKRSRMFGQQLGDTITMMANSLRAGYSLLQTMEMAARESPEPMSTEFKRVVREVGLGISPQHAMNNMMRRVPSEDLDLLVTAINIQHEVGGNLAKILDVMGETIRERVRIKGEIQVLTAQGQISGYIITALPIGLVILLFLISPEYISGMFVWPWICLPLVGVALMVLGFFAMRKIVQIEV